MCHYMTINKQTEVLSVFFPIFQCIYRHFNLEVLFVILMLLKKKKTKFFRMIAMCVGR